MTEFKIEATKSPLIKQRDIAPGDLRFASGAGMPGAEFDVPDGNIIFQVGNVTMMELRPDGFYSHGAHIRDCGAAYNAFREWLLKAGAEFGDDGCLVSR